VAFGFNPLVDPKTASFIGYPEVLASRLDLDVTNASCPGEATGGFVSLLGSDYLCQPYRDASFPLHIGYSSSQLDFAVAFLRDYPDTRLVTLDIGANDFFALEKQCAATTTPALCTAAGLPSMLQRLANNLQTIYSRIRGDAHYTHQIVALTYYALDSSDSIDVSVIESINTTIANATFQAHGQVADGFRAFLAAAQASGGDACAAGLLVVTRPNPLTCDIHPSAQGRDLLASAIQDVVQEHEDG
jgi:lysophospholipase L1-like esterase